MLSATVIIFLAAVFATMTPGCGDNDLQFPDPPAVTFAGPETEIVPDSASPNKFPSRGRAVSMHTDGSMVIVYDGNYEHVYGQRYDAQGNEVGTEFEVTVDHPNYRGRGTNSAVSHLAGGGFVVSWLGNLSGAENDDEWMPLARIFDNTGKPSGSEINFSTTPLLAVASSAAYPNNAVDVAASASGFVVVWQGATHYSLPDQVYGQRFTNLGQTAGTTFQVNTWTSGYHADPSIAAAADGRFVVSWTNGPFYDGGGYSYTPSRDRASSAILAQQYDEEGNADGPEFLVNQFPDYAQTHSDVAISSDTGNFVVVWRSNYGDDGYEPGYGYTLSDSVTMRRFDASGVAEDEVHLNSYTSGAQVEPAVAMADDGSFVVVWRSVSSYHSPDNRDDAEGGLFSRCFTANGEGGGTEIHINSYTTGRQANASVTTDGDGSFLVSWTNQDAFYSPPVGMRRLFTHTQCDTTPPGPSPIELTKTDSGALWSAGGLLTYTLSVTNNSGATIDATLTDRVPNKTTWSQTDSDAGWDCTGGGAARETCTYAISGLGDGQSVDVSFAVTVDEDTPSLWWLYNTATATINGTTMSSRGFEATPLDLCNVQSLDPSLCSAACYILPDFCDDDASAGLTSPFILSLIRDNVGYPELEIRDEVLAETRGGQRAIDLYYEQSANAAAAAEADTNVATTALAAGGEWEPIFLALADGSADTMTISQAAVDATLAFTTALRSAAGPELAAVLDRELPRLDIEGWVGMSASEIVDEVANLTCEGFETALFCGEITGDCLITATDALAVLRIAVGTLASVAEADVDGNGSVTATDALQTLSIAVGILPQTDSCND